MDPSPKIVNKSKNNFLEVETALALEARKMLYVLRAGEEKILIATDAEKTTFLTKLEDKNIPNNVIPLKKPKAVDIALIEDEIEIEETPQKVKTFKHISKENSENPKVFKDLLKRLQS